jgi:hypothetical protein
MYRVFRALTPLTLVALLVLSGCDLFGSDDSSRVTLNAAAVNGSGVASKAFAEHVDIGSVDLLFKSIRFHADDDAVEDGEGEPVEGEDEGSEGSASFHTAPVVVTVTPDGGTYEVAVADVPAGTYEAISFHLHKPRGNQEVEDFPEFAGDTPDERWSIVVWTPDPDGEEGPEEPAVLYRSSINVVQEVEFDPPFDVEDGAGHSATLTVDFSQWFVGPGGVDLDPTDDSEQNRALIDQSIRNSFRLFPDEDEDAAPDED